MLNRADQIGPRITAAVCAFNEERFLRDVVASLTRQTLPARDFEIIVVDNNSTDGSAAVLNELARELRGRLRVIVESSPGLSNARNRALAEAKSPIVAFIDADAVAEPNWLAALLAVFDDSPDAAVVGGPVRVQWDHPRPRWWEHRLDEALNAWDAGDEHAVLTYPRYPYGTNFAVRAEPVRKAGAFRTTLGRKGRALLAGEEGELCVRIEQADWRIYYVPGAIVHHRTAAARLSRRYILRRAFHHGRSQRLVEAMHGLRSETYLSWPRITWMIASRAATLRCDLPFLKFITFRIGYNLQAMRATRFDRETASDVRIHPLEGENRRNLKIAAIVQARMTSSRLPGKVLRTVADKPMIEFLIERLRQCRMLDGIIVATSADANDDPIEAFCRSTGVECHRGPLEDVAARFAEAAEAHQLDAFVRICADSPLLDSNLVDLAVGVFREGRFDLVTNVMTRTFPSGQSVEVMRTETFISAMSQMGERSDREHVTPVFYRHADRFRIYNVTGKEDRSQERLVVDTPEDWNAFTAIVAAMDRPQWLYGLEEILELRRQPLRSGPAREAHLAAG